MLPPARFRRARAILVLIPVSLIKELHESTTFHGVLRPEAENENSPFRWRGLELRGLRTSVAIGDVAEIDVATGVAPVSTEPVGERLHGWYGQAAWDLPSLREGTGSSLTPFARNESLDTQDRAPAGFSRNPPTTGSF